MGAEVKRSPGATYWANWQYTPDEWRHFDKLEWRHTWWLAGQQLGIGVALGLVICISGGVFGVFRHYNEAEWSIMLWALACLFGFILLFGMWFAWREYSFGQTLQTGRRQGPRAVCISPNIVQIGAGKSLLIRGYPPRELVSVTLRRAQPALLQFTTLTAKRTPSARRYTLWVPVPTGHEAEAAALAERFRREVIGKDRVYWDTPRAPQPPPPPAGHPPKQP